MIRSVFAGTNICIDVFTLPVEKKDVTKEKPTPYTWYRNDSTVNNSERLSSYTPKKNNKHTPKKNNNRLTAIVNSPTFHATNQPRHTVTTSRETETLANNGDSLSLQTPSAASPEGVSEMIGRSPEDPKLGESTLSNNIKDNNVIRLATRGNVSSSRLHLETATVLTQRSSSSIGQLRSSTLYDETNTRDSEAPAKDGDLPSRQTPSAASPEGVSVHIGGSPEKKQHR
jgi:hypothetical protein